MTDETVLKFNQSNKHGENLTLDICMSGLVWRYCVHISSMVLLIEVVVWECVSWVGHQISTVFLNEEVIMEPDEGKRTVFENIPFDPANQGK